MASLKTIRKRIRSVKNTQQITKAMKMVAAAKLRRAQDAIIAARPFAQKMEDVLQGIAARVDVNAHPLLQRREMRRVEVIILTSDRGLCGGFNSNVLRKTQRFLIENSDKYESIELRTMGRKAHEFFRRRGVKIARDYPGIFGKLSFGTANDIAKEVTQKYLAGEIDGVFLVYNEFVSAISQRVSVKEMLPIAPVTTSEEAKKAAATVEYLYEPGRDRVLSELLPRHLATQIWRALLESQAAEHGARMSAMENATNNASDMISRLTLMYNRTRQAGITKELMEIVSGAEALK